MQRARPLLAVPLLPLAATLGCCVFSNYGWNGAPSDHFDGSRFHNEDPFAVRGMREVLRFAWERTQPLWTAVEAEPGPPPPERLAADEMRVTVVGHSTVLLQLGGANLLADPVWSDRVGPVSWAGPRRVRPPGLRFEDLPPIDAVLVSHDHYDHLDLPTLLRLQQEHDPLFLTGLGNAAFLRHQGIDRVLEMDWWEERRVTADVDVAFVPAQHFSGRGLCDQRASLWGGFVVRGPAGDAYFAGDTGYGIHFREIRERYGSPRLAVLPIGAFRPEWFMQPIHMGPAGALDAFADLGPTAAVAIHWDSFALGDDAQGEAVAELRRRLPAAELTEDDFWILEPGEGRDVP